eukprot:scaffold20669_cov49-Phaeocystis_antarctica.AAC.1
MMLLGAAVVQGFAGSARPGHAALASTARSAVAMATGNPIGAILEKAGIDMPGPDISGLPPQVSSRGAEPELRPPGPAPSPEPEPEPSPALSRSPDPNPDRVSSSPAAPAAWATPTRTASWRVGTAWSSAT